MEIKAYTQKYEDSWIRCRTLSFLYTQYYDDVFHNKPEIHGIELICIEDDIVVGLIDVEVSNSYCSYDKNKRGAMIETIAVHPDYQFKGIGNMLLAEVEKRLFQKEIEYIEAWTREDESSNKWYIKNRFEQFNSYYHVFTNGEIIPDNAKFQPIYSFGHVLDRTQIDEDVIDRIYECRGYVKQI
ncbi:GNAT family N-acetyltransferase [Macrococcoides canis]|uniref:GNAT family N-acetyltransferase n=1 Tax=Macrococcoides canis TaxID=1855823 RepID=UPI001F32C0C7|nr:GNAT family N-acetyltransferase [Macrococcus canis]UJS27445.1 GNAT family N-acetyltransferase [Macrococcus canis]